MITGAAPLPPPARGQAAGGEAGSGRESAWTAEEIRERLADAGDTLRRLPKPQGLERSLQSPWPDMLRDWLAYGWDRTQVRRAAPSPQAITRLDEVLAWLHILSAPQRAVLWAREAERMSWPRVAFLDSQVNRQGRQIRQLRNIKEDAEARILAKLNGTPQRMRIPLRDGCRSRTKATPSGSAST